MAARWLFVKQTVSATYMTSEFFSSRMIDTREEISRENITNKPII